MKKMLMAAVVLAALAAAADSAAQRGPGRGRGAGWMPGSGYARMFDPKTLETVAGEVTAVESFSVGRGLSKGVHLVLKTEKETLSVHLGPAWYIDNQGPAIAAKDKIEVTGSRVVFEGKPALIAREVRKGEEVLRLRDEDGTPRWAGWRRR